MIFMDCQMPEMDGFEATARIRDLENHRPDAGSARHVPIVALTANAIAGDREKYLALGFDGYLSKPLNVEQLKQQLIFACVANSA